MNPFTTFPKFIQLAHELRRYNRIEPAVMKARAAGDYEEERRIMLAASQSFAQAMARKLKCEITVIGEENIPDEGPVYLVSNHQSYADILMVFYAMKKYPAGFIAKDEFKNVPVFSKSLELTRSVMIDRGNTREAVKTMGTATEYLKEGFSMAIYPEGTRSRCHDMGEFKAGSFKPAQKAGVPILPVTVDGGYHLLEETGSYQPCKCSITFHPLVHFEQMDRKEQHQAIKDIEETIRQGLDGPCAAD